MQRLIDEARADWRGLMWMGTYPEACALTLGLDDGLGKSLIQGQHGFQGFLKARFKVPLNVVYWSPIAGIAIPDLNDGKGWPDAWRVSAVQDATATNLLYDLLLEFLSEHRGAKVDPRAGGSVASVAKQTIADIARRPTAFTPFGTYPEVVAFIVGFGVGAGRTWLVDGFRTWLRTARGESNRLLVPIPSVSEVDRLRLARLSDEEGRESIRALCDLYAEYIDLTYDRPPPS